MVTSIEVKARVFTIALTVHDMLTFQIFDIQNLGQCHRLHHWQHCHSMATINVYQSQQAFLYASFKRFADNKV